MATVGQIGFNPEVGMAMIELPDAIQELSLLLIRLVLATAFIVSARNKFKNIKKFAKQNDIPVPLAYLVVPGELLGGLAMLVGILPQLAAAGLMVLMLGTMSMHVLRWKSPYWANKGGWEYDLMLFCLASVILVSGAGSYSLFG